MPESTGLCDLSPMPFGMHRGKEMQEVPASYFHYLWTTGKSEDKTCPVAAYIRRNLDALKKEFTDGIWDT